MARRTYVAAIDNVDVATADESQCVAELNAADKVAAAKRQLAIGAHYESATRTHANTVHALTVRTNDKWERTE